MPDPPSTGRPAGPGAGQPRSCRGTRLRPGPPMPAAPGRDRLSPAVGGEMLVVLRGCPVTAPPPADRDERPPGRVAVPDHRRAAPGPVGPPGRGGRVDGAACDLGVLERVDVDRQPV